MPVSRRTREEEERKEERGHFLYDDRPPSPEAAQLAARIAAVTRGRQWLVAGSNGHTYTVRQHNVDGGFTCTCPAFGFGHGKECKHIIEIKIAEQIAEEK